MKRFLIALIVPFVLLGSASRAFAQSTMCNQRCDIDSDCGSGYRCYVGVCRLDVCPAISTCVCSNGQASASPTVKPLAPTTPRPTATATVKPTRSPQGMYSATPSASPKTGFNSWSMAGAAFAMFLVGSALFGEEKIFSAGKLSPQELFRKRLESKK